MTIQEKDSIKQIRKELIVLRLQTKTLTEEEFKKSLDKIIKWVDKLTDDQP